MTALDRWAAAADPAAAAQVLAALAAARLLVPVLARARPGPSDTSAHVEVVTLVGRNGRRGLPVFSSLDALARWDAAARPVPLDACRAAAAAGAEGAELLVLDAAGPVRFVVRPEIVRALANGWCGRPAYDDPSVQAAAAVAVEGEQEVLAAYLEPAAAADAQLGLLLRPDTSLSAAAEVATRVAARLTRSAAVRLAVTRGVDVALLPAPPPGRPPVAGTAPTGSR